MLPIVAAFKTLTTVCPSALATIGWQTGSSTVRVLTGNKYRVYAAHFYVFFA
jgi:hypothetical protein